MSSSYKPFFKVTWHTPDGKPPEKYRRKKPAEVQQAKEPQEQAAASPPQAEGASPAPPENGVFGEANDAAAESATPQSEASQHLTENGHVAKDDLLHHEQATAAEASCGENGQADDDEQDDATSSGETAYEEALAAILGPMTAGALENPPDEVVKQTSGDSPSRWRNTPLTKSEDDRFLMCLTYGLSMRQAAAAVGIHHTTMVKRAKRDKTFAALIAHARTQARSNPLLEVQQASKKSWRAAAWLLSYLERRDNRGSSKAS